MERLTAHKGFPYFITRKRVVEEGEQEYPGVGIIENLKGKNFQGVSMFGTGFPYYKLFLAEDHKYNIFLLKQNWKYVYFFPSPIEMRFISKVNHRLYWIPFNTFIPVASIDYIILSVPVQLVGVWDWDAYFELYYSNETQKINLIHTHAGKGVLIALAGGERGLVSLSPIVNPLKLNVFCAEPLATIEIRTYPFKDNFYFTVLSATALGEDAPFNQEYDLPPSFKTIIVFKNLGLADVWVYYNVTGIFEWLLQELWLDISRCDSTDDWIGTGAGAVLTLDSEDKKQGLFSLVNTVTNGEALTEYLTTYTVPAGPPPGVLDLSRQKYLRFWLKCSKTNTFFTWRKIFLYDDIDNWYSWDLPLTTEWSEIEKLINSPNEQSAVPPDLSRIKKFVINLKIGGSIISYVKKLDFIRTMN